MLKILLLIILLVNPLLSECAPRKTLADFDKSNQVWGDIEVLGNGVIAYWGPLDEDAMSRVATVYRTRKFFKIILTSDGGMFDQGIAIGKFIRSNGIKVEVFDRCKSACALAAIGDPNFTGELQFHAPYVRDSERTPQEVFAVARAKARMAEYVKEMGFPQIPVTAEWYTLKGK